MGAKWLDCETPELAYSSFESIFGLSRAQLDFIFADFHSADWYDIHGWPSGEKDLEDLLYDRFQSIADVDASYDGICWFHLSRVLRHVDYSNGLLPLNLMLEQIWSNLFLLVHNKISKSDWEAFRQQVQEGHLPGHRKFDDSAYQYNLKSREPDNCGPYAFLLKDVIKADCRNHYLRCPEIIEDIGICCKEMFGVDLLAAYKQNSRSCVVKFRSYGMDNKAIPSALYYLLQHFYGSEANTAHYFEGNGIIIPAEQILRVEFFG